MKAAKVITLALLVLLTLSMGQVDQAGATPAAGGMATFSSGAGNGQVSWYTEPNPPKNYHFYSGVVGWWNPETETSTKMPFWGRYQVNKGSQADQLTFLGMDESSGLEFSAVMTLTHRDPQFHSWNIRILFPAVQREWSGYIVYRFLPMGTQSTEPVPVWPRDLTPGPPISYGTGYAYLPVAIGSNAIDPLGQEARSYPDLFGAWVSEGGIQNNFRDHLLALGVIRE